MGSIIKYLFSFIGLVLLVGGIWSYISTQSFVNSAVYAEGKVIEMVRVVSSDDSYSYRPIVSFHDHRGEVVEFTNSVGSNPPSYSIGESVDVLYQEENPSNAKIDGFFSLWFLPAGLAFLGFSFFATGLSLIAFNIFGQRKAEHLRTVGMSIKASVRSIKENTLYRVNYNHPYQIHADWKNPLTGELHSFKSKNIWSDPSSLMPSDSVTVFIDRNNPNKYHMDISFLPKKMR